MIAEYERYHGVVLRELIVTAPGPLVVEKKDEIGRVNSFCLNGHTGLHIKHCSKRLPPWQFTFLDEHLEEIAMLERKCDNLWLALACGMDGIVSLSADEFRKITGASEDTTRFVRVDRDRRTMYRVFGNAGKLASAKARGISPVISDAFPLKGAA
jgi:hypothetical protein